MSLLTPNFLTTFKPLCSSAFSNLLYLFKQCLPLDTSGSKNRFRPQDMRSDRLEDPKRCNTVPYVVVTVKLVTEKPRMLYVCCM